MHFPRTFNIARVDNEIVYNMRGTRLHRKLMKYREKLIELIIQYIHCKNMWNNGQHSHKSKEVTCIFILLSGFSFISCSCCCRCPSGHYADHKTSACTRQRQNFESSLLIYFCDCSHSLHILYSLIYLELVRTRLHLKYWLRSSQNDPFPNARSSSPFDVGLPRTVCAFVCGLSELDITP